MAKRATTKAEQPIMRGAKAIPADDRPIPGSYIAASLYNGDPATSRYSNNTGRDFEMVCRGVAGTVYRAASINSTCLASQTLRLYRRAGRQNKRYVTRRVDDRRTLKYLQGYGQIRPTMCKGANYAAKAGDDVEEVLSHPILDVLQNPDPVYSGQVWMQAIWFQREVAGRAYLWAGERTNGIPTSLYILPSAYTWPVLSLEGLISGYVYARNRTAMLRCESEDVVYLRHQANPFNPAGAMSWLNSVTAESDMEAAALQAEVARWNNGGMPGMVFKASPTTTDQQMDQMNAALARRVQGVGKAGSMLLLRDTELVQYATKPHEMQYVAGMEATEKRIYDAAGVPESIYRLNSANLASATVSDTQYAKHTLAPRLATMASELTELLLPMFGVEPGEMWFMFDNPVRDDVIALAAEYRAAELQGIITPNEYRKLLDLEALPDEQNAMRFRQTEAPAPVVDPFAMMGKPAAEAEETEDDDAESEDDAEEETPDEPETKAVSSRSDSGACKCGACGTNGGTNGADAASTDAAGVVGDCKAGASVHGPIKLKGFIDEWDEAAQVPKSTAKLFYQFQNAMQAWYAATMPAMVNDQFFVELPSPEAMRTFHQITDTFIGKVLENGAAVGIAKITGATESTWNIANEGAMKYVRDRSFELAKSVPETMKGTVQAMVEKELANPEGFTTETVREAIREKVPELSGYQAERLARTETADAFSEGQRQAWKAEGINMKQWLIGGGPCPDCEGVAAKYPNPIPIDEPFVYNGQAKQAPTWHPNCVLPDTRVQLPPFQSVMRAAYRGRVVEIRTTSGSVLTVTENHPVLTDSGWKFAAQLTEADNLVSTCGLHSSDDPNMNDVIPTAKHVFEAAMVASGMTTRSVPASTEHLHGDGASVDGQISVVRTNGGLVANVEPTFCQQCGQTTFKITDPEATSLTGGGTFGHALLALSAAANGCVSLCNVASVLLGSAGAHAEAVSLDDAAMSEAKLLETASQNAPGASELIGKTVNGPASDHVKFVGISQLIVREYSGHVYNFSTFSSVYVSNGIVSHNCRCAISPSVEVSNETE